MPITTGPANLPNIGELSYSGVEFNCLYRSQFNAKPVPDRANRTIKVVEVTLDVEGVITLPANAANLDASVLQIRQALETQGGQLVYNGNGCGALAVNLAADVRGSSRDVAWGPVPKLLMFRPLGQGRGIEVHWQVTTWLVDFPNPNLQGVLELNFESSVGFDDEDYSFLTMKGTLEVPFGRITPNNQTMTRTVDDFREQWLNIKVDLTKFRVTKRDFQTSRDKRTIEWSFATEELPPMGLPKYATKARGVMEVKPIAGAGGRTFPQATARWSCTLRVTYTIRKDFRADTALLLFYALLWFRMRSSQNGVLPSLDAINDGNQQRRRGGSSLPFLAIVSPVAAVGNLAVQAGGALFRSIRNFTQQFRSQQAQFGGAAGGAAGAAAAAAAGGGGGKQTPGSAMLTYFAFYEGLHLDSKTITFEASWMLLTTFQTLMRATGVWRWTSEIGGTTWAASVQDIVGWKSWNRNLLNPNMCYIVDMNTGIQPYTEPLFRRE